MRDIKFRVWSESRKKWLNECMFDMDVKGTYDFSSDASMRYNYKTDVHIMQYTGLKDSNGTDIYEGDIVYLAGQGDELMEFPFMELYQAYAESDIGVIKGNIYENPELIGAIA